MTPEELKRIRFHARAMAAQMLIANTGQGQADPAAIRELAAGMVEGICDTLTAYADERTAYTVVQQVIDGIGAQLAFQQPAAVPL